MDNIQNQNYYIVDYVWIDGNCNLRSKIRVVENVKTVNDIPDWDYDGSSTNQATTEKSEIVLKPRRLFNCPFRKNGFVVMCDTYILSHNVNDSSSNFMLTPALNNNRYQAAKIFAQYSDSEPWYGLEQEYFILGTNKLPLGFNIEKTQGQYYCSVGYENTFGRVFVDAHLQCCLHAGIKISGVNAEVAPGQWEFQIGPVEGIDAADQLWIARYFLEKLSENFGVFISYHPKPLKGSWNGSGCHTNFSTESMRNEGGIEHIHNAIKCLQKNHNFHMENYGLYNRERMSGQNETSNFEKFSFGTGDRTASIRIPTKTVIDSKGYFEDRRPAANCDPYVVTSMILKTVLENNV